MDDERKLKIGDEVEVLHNRWSQKGQRGVISQIVPKGFIFPEGTVMVMYPPEEGHYPYNPHEVRQLQ